MCAHLEHGGDLIPPIREMSRASANSSPTPALHVRSERREAFFCRHQKSGGLPHHSHGSGASNQFQRCTNGPLRSAPQCSLMLSSSTPSKATYTDRGLSVQCERRLDIEQNAPSAQTFCEVLAGSGLAHGANFAASPEREQSKETPSTPRQVDIVIGSAYKSH